METKHSPWSKKHFKPKKGVPNIPQKSRPAVSADWSIEIDRLEKVFESISIPEQPFLLNRWTKINDLRFCIDADIAVVRANIGKRAFLSSLEQLQQIELMLVPDKEREARKAELIPKQTQPSMKKAKRQNEKSAPVDDFVLEMTS
ncbi:MAG: hypothetical protein M0Q53_07365 [Prolixibacteraceae bacterium]|jgi:hypothetical protein|nr:hypothetical protein [Prolixibacteraceae bacterium]